MKTISVKPLSVEAFAPFGTYCSITNPVGFDLNGFYRDQVRMPVSGRVPVAFSPLTVQKPEKMIVTSAEYHDYTPEIVLPMDDDVVLHVAPASAAPVPELTEAFLVPKGTLVCLHIGTWHLAALPVHNPEVHVLIALPERTYFNDCHVVEYAPEDQVEITL